MILALKILSSIYIGLGTTIAVKRFKNDEYLAGFIFLTPVAYVLVSFMVAILEKLS